MALEPGANYSANCTPANELRWDDFLVKEQANIDDTSQGVDC